MVLVVRARPQLPASHDHVQKIGVPQSWFRFIQPEVVVCRSTSLHLSPSHRSTYPFLSASNSRCILEYSWLVPLELLLRLLFSCLFAYSPACNLVRETGLWWRVRLRHT